MDEQDDDIVLLASCMVAAAAAMATEDDTDDRKMPTPRFISQILTDGGDRIIGDTFRMSPSELNELVGMCAKYISHQLCPKRVVVWQFIGWPQERVLVHKNSSFWIKHTLQFTSIDISD
ncbi:hypothetical protein AC1031_011824 [Aphanomyces cochlioides]|nr:hypothetical protein AC1031_011824 [Aphanomyces cochlioides]